MSDLAGLAEEVGRLREELAETRHRLDLLEDRNAIEQLQYAYGYFIDNRMFREMTDLFSDEGAWIEIGQRGRATRPVSYTHLTLPTILLV